MTQFTLDELYNHYLQTVISKENVMSKEEFEKCIYNPRIFIYGK